METNPVISAHELQRQRAALLLPYNKRENAIESSGNCIKGYKKRSINVVMASLHMW